MNNSFLRLTQDLIITQSSMHSVPVQNADLDSARFLFIPKHPHSGNVSIQDVAA